jgi:sortase A
VPCIGSWVRRIVRPTATTNDGNCLRNAGRALVLLLALAGVVAVGHGGWLYAKAGLGQLLLEQAWTKMRATGTPERPWPWADTWPVARLIAPSAGASVLVLAGASGRTLAWGPGHLDDSAPPGMPGNAIVSAHRDTHFRFLRDVAVGDDLVVELADGTRRHYRVRERFVGDAHDLRLPRSTPVPTLTLVTCYPFDALVPGGPLRLVVIAEAE